jgi:hypothetical protein
MPEITVNLPTLHARQVEAFHAHCDNRFLALRCGRRWGKTAFDTTLSVDAALKGWPVGWFAPQFRFLNEPYSEMVRMLGGALGQSSEQKGRISTVTGGHIDIWTLDNPNAGRGRKYKLVVVDEAAFAKSDMVEIWRRNIRPTLVDFRGSAVVSSNTNGVDDQNFFWQICNDAKHQFIDFHAPTSSNPYIPSEELEELKASSHPLVWRQEFLSEFVDFSGVSFFSLDKLLIEGQPAPYPTHCDAVVAVIDSAAKTGKLNDGTAVAWAAYTRSPIGGPNLVILDWDLQQIEGALLETWLPGVLRIGEELAAKCGARHGSIGAFIEDKSSGTILLQQAQRRNLSVRAIDSKLTQMGKSERALSVSGYVHQNRVKFSDVAYNRTVTYKEITRNHMLSQVTGFRMGQKDDHAQDDCLDVACYLIAVTLGDSGGF